MEHFETLKEVGIPLEPIWDDEVLQAVAALPEEDREAVKGLLSMVYPAQAPYSRDLGHSLQSVKYLATVVKICKQHEKNCNIEAEDAVDLPSAELMKKMMRCLDPLRVCCYRAHCPGCYIEWKKATAEALAYSPQKVVFGRYNEVIASCAGYSIACVEKESQEAMASKILHYYIHLAQFCFLVHFQKEAAEQIKSN